MSITVQLLIDGEIVVERPEASAVFGAGEARLEKGRWVGVGKHSVAYKKYSLRDREAEVIEGLRDRILAAASSYLAERKAITDANA